MAVAETKGEWTVGEEEGGQRGRKKSNRNVDVPSTVSDVNSGLRYQGHCRECEREWKSNEGEKVEIRDAMERERLRRRESEGESRKLARNIPASGSKAAMFDTVTWSRPDPDIMSDTAHQSGVPGTVEV